MIVSRKRSQSGWRDNVSSRTHSKICKRDRKIIFVSMINLFRQCRHKSKLIDIKAAHHNPPKTAFTNG